MKLLLVGFWVEPIPVDFLPIPLFMGVAATFFPEATTTPFPDFLGWVLGDFMAPKLKLASLRLMAEGLNGTDFLESELRLGLFT